MRREYLRVTPTSEEYAASSVPETIASLHKLQTAESQSLGERLNPLYSTPPPTFEFLALSQGDGEPVEFYYGVTGGQLDTFEKRLRTIYPPSFDISRVTLDPIAKLVSPAEYTHEEFRERVEHDQLYRDCELEESNQRPAATDGGATNEASSRYVDCEGGVIELASPDEIPKEQPWTKLDRPTATPDGRVLARPPIDDVSPVGVRWQGEGERKRDWMTPLTAFTTSATQSGSADESDQGRAPLAPLIDLLTEVDQPTAFQVVFRRKPDWTSSAVDRQADLLAGRDTLGQKVLGFLLDDNWERTAADLRGDAKRRYDRIEDNSPERTFTTNLRVVSVPSEDSVPPSLESSLETMCSALDSLDGRFYGVDGQRLREGGLRQKTKEKRAQRELSRLRDREITTGSGATRPDLVLNGDELANFILTPSSGDLTVEGTRGTRAEQQSRNPLPRPHQDLMREFRDGMAIGYALDENGVPEGIPTHVPPGLLPTHYGRFGTTGSGKSKALINDMLSLYANTEGPVVLIDPKGDGMTENYMRAHGRRFGLSDLEENVIHFPVPDVLPGFSFFNLEPSLENGRRREDAVQRKADHYEELLKLVMGEERYERATVAPTVIQSLIKTLFDEEYGRENGRYRESENYFAHQQLEHAVDQLWDAGPPQPDMAEVPQTSDEEIERTIRRQLQLDSSTFSNVMGGVGNRLAYISQDTHLRKIFNNTERRFDFRDVLDENKVILFDLGDLRDDAATIMTGVILTNLDDALKERKRNLDRQPDEYVANLLIDEAASVVVSDIMNDLLEKGRGFRLSVGLSMQFPEQIEAEGGRKVYLNALNNIGTSLVGKINVDQEMAQAMAHEEMDPVDFANRIRSLPRGEWIASLPSPTFGKTGPYPFSVEPLPIPEGHPESTQPLTDEEEERFQETLTAIQNRVSDGFGVSEEAATPDASTPDELREVLSVTTDDLDVAIAKTIRSVQLQRGVREENEWVPVETVDGKLRQLYQDVDADPPSVNELTDIRQRSRLVDTTVDIEADDVVVQLTEAGEQVATPDTGNVRAAGSSDHDDALLEIESELTSLGFTVSILSQDGSEKPDARATHPDLDPTFAIEVETTTPENPSKVLTNLRKAQEAEEIPLFVVRTDDSQTYWAERVEGILSPPVRVLQSGEQRFYTSDSSITFNGGATEQGGVTAVRPVAIKSDTDQSVWTHDEGDIVLRDGQADEHIRLRSLDELTKDRVPAVYSYDPAADEYVVDEHGERHVYEEKSAFESEWSRIKRPFVPEDTLPVPEYDQRSYAIIVLEDGDQQPFVYRNGDAHPLSELLETSFTVGNPEPSVGEEKSVHTKTETEPARSDPGSSPEADSDLDDGESDTASTSTPGETKAEWKDDPDAAVAKFAEDCLRESESGATTSAAVYATYESWAEQHGISPDSKNWFARRLSNHVDFERTVGYRDGSSVRCYEGVELAEGWTS
ncbi:primase-like DNA-binding domain-containing protein [Natronoarchaeum mannanilyticum]|uniref:DNA primase/nucleoside triphosphatase C-terminal domain-containing protein n=1 Tax=Natronoarchaeum mannanilyticum TaxID=926360 RepID=A0AAV3TEE3_9EURY